MVPRGFWPVFEGSVEVGLRQSSLELQLLHPFLLLVVHAEVLQTVVVEAHGDVVGSRLQLLDGLVRLQMQLFTLQVDLLLVDGVGRQFS